MSQVNQGVKCHQREDHNNYVSQMTIFLFSLFPGNDTITLLLIQYLLYHILSLYRNIRPIPILSDCVKAHVSSGSTFCPSIF